MAKKKKTTKKRVISKTEKALRNKLHYQQQKFNKHQKAINAIYEEFKPLEVIVVKEINRKQKNGKIKKIKYEFTTENAVTPHQNEMLKINKVKEELYKKLERFKYKPKKPIGKSLEIFEDENECLGMAWDKKDILKRLLRGVEFHNVDGFDVKTEPYSIVMALDSLILKMDSETALCFREIEDGKIELYITKDDQAFEQLKEL